MVEEAQSEADDASCSPVHQRINKLDEEVPAIPLYHSRSTSNNKGTWKARS